MEQHDEHLSPSTLFAANIYSRTFRRKHVDEKSIKMAFHAIYTFFGWLLAYKEMHTYKLWDKKRIYNQKFRIQIFVYFLILSVTDISKSRKLGYQLVCMNEASACPFSYVFMMFDQNQKWTLFMRKPRQWQRQQRENGKGAEKLVYACGEKQSKVTNSQNMRRNDKSTVCLV